MMEPWQQHEHNLHLLAINLYNTVGRIRQGITRQTLQDFSQTWLENQDAEEGKKEVLNGAVGMAPSIIEMQVNFVISHLQFRVPEAGANEIPIHLDTLHGTVGDQRHKWLELSSHDRIAGPLPRVYIIDVAARGIDPSHILIGPDSPFRLLYRRSSSTGS